MFSLKCDNSYLERSRNKKRKAGNETCEEKLQIQCSKSKNTGNVGIMMIPATNFFKKHG